MTGGAMKKLTILILTGILSCMFLTALTPTGWAEETTEEDDDAVEEPRQRPEDSRLQVSLSARLFTRSTVAVPVVEDDGEGDGGDGGDGS